MKRRTFVLGLGTAAVGGSALLGSGAFSRTESQRDVVIETVGDDDAYLRLVYQDRAVGNCDRRITLVTLTNQFNETLTDIDATFETTNGDITFTGLETPDELAVGESGEVTVEATCAATEPVTATVTFGVELEGEDSSVTVQDRSITVTCECPDREPETQISYVAFCGDRIGAGDIEITSIDVSAERVHWQYTGDGEESDLERIVLGGEFSGCDVATYQQTDCLLNFEGDDITTPVTAGEETKRRPNGHSGQTPDCPCIETRHGVKFNVADDGSVEDPESGCRS